MSVKSSDEEAEEQGGGVVYYSEPRGVSLASEFVRAGESVQRDPETGRVELQAAVPVESPPPAEEEDPVPAAAAGIQPQQIASDDEFRRELLASGFSEQQAEEMIRNVEEGVAQSAEQRRLGGLGGWPRISFSEQQTPATEEREASQEPTMIPADQPVQSRWASLDPSPSPGDDDDDDESTTTATAVSLTFPSLVSQPSSPRVASPVLSEEEEEEKAEEPDNPDEQSLSVARAVAAAATTSPPESQPRPRLRRSTTRASLRDIERGILEPSQRRRERLLGEAIGRPSQTTLERQREEAQKRQIKEISEQLERALDAFGQRREDEYVERVRIERSFAKEPLTEKQLAELRKGRPGRYERGIYRGSGVLETETGDPKRMQQMARIAEIRANKRRLKKLGLPPNATFEELVAAMKEQGQLEYTSKDAAVELAVARTNPYLRAYARMKSIATEAVNEIDDYRKQRDAVVVENVRLRKENEGMRAIIDTKLKRSVLEKLPERQKLQELVLVQQKRLDRYELLLEQARTEIERANKIVVEQQKTALGGDSRMAKELDKRLREKTKAEQDVLQLRVNLDSTKADLQRERNENVRLSENVKNLERRVTKLDKDLLSAASAETVLKSTNNSLKADIAAGKASLRVCQDRVKELEKKVVDAAAESAKDVGRATVVDARVTELQNTISTKDILIKDLESKVKDWTTRHTKLNETFLKNRDEFDRFKASNAMEKIDMERCKKELSDLKTKYDKLVKNYASAKAGLDIAQDEKTQHNADMKASRDRIKELRSSLASVNSSNAQLKAELAAEKSELLSTTAERDQLRKTETKLTRRVDNLQKENLNQKADIRRLEAEKTALEQQQKVNLDRIDEEIKATDKVSKELAVAKGRLDILESGVKGRVLDELTEKARADGLSKRIDKLSRELRKVQREKNELASKASVAESALQAEKASFEQSKIQLQAAVSNLQTSKTTLQTQHNATMSSIKAGSEAAKSRLESKIQELTADAKRLKESSDAFEKESKKQRDELVGINLEGKKQIDAANIVLDDLRARVKVLETQLAQEKKRYSDAKTQLGRSDRTIAENEIKIDNLELELQRYKTEVVRLRKTATANTKTFRKIIKEGGVRGYEKFIEKTISTQLKEESAGADLMDVSGDENTPPETEESMLEEESGGGEKEKEEDIDSKIMDLLSEIGPMRNLRRFDENSPVDDMLAAIHALHGVVVKSEGVLIDARTAITAGSASAETTEKIVDDLRKAIDGHRKAESKLKTDLLKCNADKDQAKTEFKAVNDTFKDMRKRLTECETTVANLKFELEACREQLDAHKKALIAVAEQTVKRQSGSFGAESVWGVPSSAPSSPQEEEEESSLPEYVDPKELPDEVNRLLAKYARQQYVQKKRGDKGGSTERKQTRLEGRLQTENDSLIEKNAELESKVRARDRRISAKDTEIAELNRQLTEIQTKKKKKKKSRAEESEMGDDDETSGESLEELRQRLSDKESIIKALNVNADNNKAQLKSMEDDAEKLRGDLLKAKSDNALLSGKLKGSDKANREHLSEITKLQTELTTLKRSRLSSQSGASSRFQDERTISKLKAEKKELKDEVDELTKELDKMRTASREGRAAGSELEACKSKLDKCKRKTRSLQREVTNLKKDLEKCRNDAKDKIRSHSGDTEQYEKRVLELEGEIAKLKTKDEEIRTRDARIKVLEADRKRQASRYSELTKKNSQAINDLQKRLDEKTFAQATSSSSVSSAAAFESVVKARDATIKDLNKRIGSLSNDIKKERASKSELENKYDLAKSQIMDLNKSLKQARTDRNKALSEKRSCELKLKANADKIVGIVKKAGISQLTDISAKLSSVSDAIVSTGATGAAVSYGEISTTLTALDQYIKANTDTRSQYYVLVENLFEAVNGRKAKRGEIGQSASAITGTLLDNVSIMRGELEAYKQRQQQQQQGLPERAIEGMLEEKNSVIADLRSELRVTKSMLEAERSASNLSLLTTVAELQGPEASSMGQQEAGEGGGSSIDLAVLAELSQIKNQFDIAVFGLNSIAVDAKLSAEDAEMLITDFSELRVNTLTRNVAEKMRRLDDCELQVVATQDKNTELDAEVELLESELREMHEHVTYLTLRVADAESSSPAAESTEYTERKRKMRRIGPVQQPEQPFVWPSQQQPEQQEPEPPLAEKEEPTEMETSGRRLTAPPVAPSVYVSVIRWPFGRRGGQRQMLISLYVLPKLARERGTTGGDIDRLDLDYAEDQGWEIMRRKLPESSRYGNRNAYNWVNVYAKELVRQMGNNGQDFTITLVFVRAPSSPSSGRKQIITYSTASDARRGRRRRVFLDMFWVQQHQGDGFNGQLVMKEASGDREMALLEYYYARGKPSADDVIVIGI